MKNFGERLKHLRKLNKLSQEDLAIKINVSRSLIAKYENNLGNPSEEVLLLLCDYFKVEKSYFYISNSIKIHDHYILYRNCLVTLILSFIYIIYLLGGSYKLDPVILDNECYIKEIFAGGFICNVLPFIWIGIIVVYNVLIYILLFNRKIKLKWYILIIFQLIYLISTIFFLILGLYFNQLLVSLFIIIPEIFFSIFILISSIKYIMKIFNIKISISFN